jgi:hypothetical protein
LAVLMRSWLTASEAIQHVRKGHLVRDMALLLDEHGAADGHDRGDDAVDPLGRLILGGFEVAGGVLGDGDVRGHPAVTGSSVEDAPKLGVTLDQIGIIAPAEGNRYYAAPLQEKRRWLRDKQTCDDRLTAKDTRGMSHVLLA